MSSRTQHRGAWILATTILGSSMAFIDGTVVNVALPALQRSLGATVLDVQWIIEAYALLFSALLLVGGALGDRFGRRRVYAIGIVLFAAASAACGLADTPRALILARGIQGVGAALLVPGSLALIAAAFPGKARGRAIGTWSGLSAMTTAFGPVLGGFLIEHYSWRWAFFLNVPVALGTLVLLFSYVPESRDETANGRLDLAGAGLVTMGLGGVVYALIESNRSGFGTPLVAMAMAAGLIGLALFFALEARTSTPMLPLSLFRSRPFAGGNLLTLLLYGALSMAFFVVPLNLIQVQGYTATAAGAATLPFILTMVILSRWSGGLSHRFGARLPLVVGPALAAAGLALLTRPAVGDSYWSTFFPAMLVFGLGMAVTVAPLTTTVMDAVDVAHAGLASGINNAVSRTAGLLAIALLTLPLVKVFNAQLERRMAALHLPARLGVAMRERSAMLAGASPPQDATPGEAAAIRQAVAESFVDGFRLVVLVAAGLALAAGGIAAVMIRPRTANEPDSIP